MDQQPEGGEKIEEKKDEIILMQKTEVVKNKAGRPKTRSDAEKREQVRNAVARHYAANREKKNAANLQQYYDKKGDEPAQPTQCTHIKRGGARCTVMTKSEKCYKHRPKMRAPKE